MKHSLEPSGWVNQYSDYLYSIAMYKINDHDLAKDLVQDTFLAAFKARDKFRGDASEKTWLTTILKNKIVDHYRSEKNNESINHYIESTNNTFINSYFDTQDMSTYGHNNKEVWVSYLASDASINRNEISSIIQYCLEKLPVKLKGVFWSKYLEEKNTPAICKEFNITPSNYWVILHRSKVLLQHCIKKAGGF